MYHPKSRGKSHLHISHSDAIEEWSYNPRYTLTHTLSGTASKILLEFFCNPEDLTKNFSYRLPPLLLLSQSLLPPAVIWTSGRKSRNIATMKKVSLSSVLSPIQRGKLNDESTSLKIRHPLNVS